MKKIHYKSSLLVLLLSASFAFSKAPISNPLDYTAQNFNVLKYEADIKFPSFPISNIIGSCKIIFKYEGEPNANPFYFHLRSLNIDSIFFNGIRTSAIASGVPTDSNYHWEVNPIGDVKKGDIANVLVYYHGQMTTAITPDGAPDWGGVQSDATYMFSMGVGFKNNYISSTQHWLPCYDHPSDKATFSCLFTVADSLFVASNGSLIGSDSNNNKRAYLWETDIPTATYLLAFAVGKYKTYPISGSQIPIEVYGLKKDSARIATNFKNVPKMISAFESRFTPYPFEKVGYAMTTIGSMEHQTMISYDYLLLNKIDTMNSVAAHELSHQWFGDLVSPIDFKHAWLNESYATFCEAIWEEYMNGPSKYLSTLVSKRANYFNAIIPKEGILPLYDFPRSGASSNYPATIYQKGALVVAMLRQELGDSLFFGATNEYLQKFAFQSIPTDSLIAVYENYSKRDLKWFFNQWVYQAGYPYFSLDYNSTTQTITVSSDGKLGEYINVPLEYSYKDSNNLTIAKIVKIDVKSGASGQFHLDAGNYKVSFDKSVITCPLLKIKLPITSVLEDKDNGFTIYPNPAQNILNVQTDFAVSALNNFVIYDVLGKKYSCDYKIASDNMISINLNNLPNGNYFIEISNGNEKFAKKFIKGE